MMKVSGLRCEYLENPLGIDVCKPRLSWSLASDRRGERQTIYRIVVSSSRERLLARDGDLWDSGTVHSDQTTHVSYAGKPLTSHQPCWWKVTVVDCNGGTSHSPCANWSMGLLDPADWKADWIGMLNMSEQYISDRDEVHLPPCPYFRKEFKIHKTLSRAIVYATAFGLYELHINGERVGDDYFMPGWTDYRKRVYYNAYDVTDLLDKGSNAIGGILADGWYSGHLALVLRRVAGMKKGREVYGKEPRLLIQLRLEYDDGTVETLGTDDSWKAAIGPHLEADILMGEVYDARLEFPWWSEPDFDDSDWDDAVIHRKLKPQTQIGAYPGVTVQRTQTLEAISRNEPRDGVFIFDIGQNISGWVRLAVAGEAGTKIVIRHGEMLNADGTLMTENLQEARATDTYILKGGEEEVWEPRFTYHGFRYVEVSGYPGTPPMDAITGIAVHSATPLVGNFECSDPLVNQLHKNIVWTQRDNFFDVPTDCPQRDERLAWTGDAGIYIKSAIYNADVAAFFTKWLVDLEDAQRSSGTYPNYAPMPYQWNTSCVNSPAWADAGIICPFELLMAYGDTGLIKKHYDSMKRFIEFQLNNSEGFIGPSKGFGDWVSVKQYSRKDLISTAYRYHCARLMSEMAQAIGRDDDALEFHDLANNYRDAFRRVFGFWENNRYYLRGDSQAVYAVAINLGLLTTFEAKLAGQRLVELIDDRDGHLSTGFIGLNHLLPALTKTGHLDTAYKLLTNDTYPSWGYSIRNGATTIWERWDSWTKEHGFKDSCMNSFCHYSFGSVCEWMFGTVAGIFPKEAGYGHIGIAPMPGGGLTWAKASYKSIHGEIVSEWAFDGDDLRMIVSIPANTVADVYVPWSGGDITEGGVPAEEAEGVGFSECTHTLGLDDSGVCTPTLMPTMRYRVGSGRYEFVSPGVNSYIPFEDDDELDEQTKSWLARSRRTLKHFCNKEEQRG